MRRLRWIKLEVARKRILELFTPPPCDDTGLPVRACTCQKCTDLRRPLL